MSNNPGISQNPPAISYVKTLIQIYLNTALTLDSSTYWNNFDSQPLEFVEYPIVDAYTNKYKSKQ
jgi:GTP-dependent phosphoenolpyruvate carboxykinase